MAVAAMIAHAATDASLLPPRATLVEMMTVNHEFVDGTQRTFILPLLVSQVAYSLLVHGSEPRLRA